MMSPPAYASLVGVVEGIEVARLRPRLVPRRDLSSALRGRRDWARLLPSHRVATPISSLF